MTIAAVLMVGLAAYILWQPSGGLDEAKALQDADVPAGVTLADQPVLPEVSPSERGKMLVGTPPGGDVKTSAKRGRVVTARGVVLPHDVVMDDYKNDLWADIRANPPALTQAGDPEVDADLAYRLYMYYGNCSYLQSQDHQVDQQIEKIAHRAETAGGRSLDRLEGRLDRIIDYYELCLPIPPEVDSRLETVKWMTRAVRLGHEIAEVQFYQKAMGFILRPDPSTNSPPLAMLYPGMVADFKTTARLGLARALEKGHPEAYLAKSQALLEGLIYPKDPVLSLAYAQAAEFEASRNHIILDNLGRWKQEATKYLDQAQIAEAEQMALELRAP